MYAPGRPDPIEAGNSQISVCYVFSLLELLESIGLSREKSFADLCAFRVKWRSNVVDRNVCTLSACFFINVCEQASDRSATRNKMLID